MSFYHRPFVCITLSFILGIVLAFVFRAHAEILFYNAVFVLFLALLFFVFYGAKGFAFFVFSMGSLCAVGCLLLLVRLDSFERNTLQRVYQPGAVTVLRICETKQGKGAWNKAIGEVVSVIADKSRQVRKDKVLLLIDDAEILPNMHDCVAISSPMLPIRNDGNPGEFNAEAYWHRQGVYAMAFVGKGEMHRLHKSSQGRISRWIAASHEFLKAALEAHLSGPELAISLALILGDNSLLDNDIRNSFTNTGALHVLAVSGLHISIIMQILMGVLVLFSGLLSRRIAVCALIGVMWWYAAVTGLSPSVLRAVFMFTVVSIAQLSGRNYDSLNTLFFTAFVLVVWNPLTVFDIGFQLSFLAMLGIFLMYEKIESFWHIQQPLLRKVWQGTAVGLAAQVMTTPLSLHYFNQFPNYFMLTNIGLMASSGLILGGGLLIFSTSWWGFAAKWIGVALMLIVGISLWFIEWVESLPGAVAFGFTPGIWTVLTLGVLFPLLFYFRMGTKRFWATALLGLGMLSGIVYQRFQNIHHNEIIVFNARFVVMAVRFNGHVFCFYRSKKEDFFKVKRVMGNYLKIHSGFLHYCSLDRHNWGIKIDGLKIEVERERAWVRITCAHHVVRLLLSEKPVVRNHLEHLIAMPWIKKRRKSHIDHYLSRKSWRLSI